MGCMARKFLPEVSKRNSGSDQQGKNRSITVFTNGDVEGPPSLYGVCYNERFNEGEFTGLISFNVAFTLFATEFEYWQAEYPKARRLRFSLPNNQGWQHVRSR